MSNLQTDVALIHLDKLDTFPASQLFLKLSSINASPINNQDAATIVEKIDRLPLAIEHVAAYICRKGMTLKEFLALYDKILLERRKDGAGGAWSYDITISWSLDCLSDSASLLLRVYSFFDPDGMQDSLVTQALDGKGAKGMLHGYQNDELLHIDARRELLKSSLITADMEKTPVNIRMHRLVQDISVAEMTKVQRSEVFAFVTEAIDAAWPVTSNSWEHEVGLWSRSEALLQHIFRLMELIRMYAIDMPNLSTRRKFIGLLSHGGWYRSEKGDFDSGIPLFKFGMELCAESLVDCLDLRADLAFVCGSAYGDTNRWPEMMVQVEDQLKYRLRADAAYGTGPTAKTGIAYSEYGLAQLLLRQFEEAVKNTTRALEIYALQPDVIEGSFFPAFPNFHRSLALFGAGRPLEGEQGLLNLIEWLTTHLPSRAPDFKSNQQELSVAAYEKSFANYQATVGMLFHRTGNVCGKLAEYHESLQQYNAADFYFSAAFNSYSSQHHHKSELARHHFIHSRALRNRGDLSAAELELGKAQTMYQEIAHLDQPLSTRLSLENFDAIVAPWVW